MHIIMDLSISLVKNSNTVKIFRIYCNFIFITVAIDRARVLIFSAF